MPKLTPPLLLLQDRVRLIGSARCSIVTMLDGMMEQFEQQKDDPIAIERLCAQIRSGAEAWGLACMVTTPSYEFEKRQLELAKTG